MGKRKKSSRKPQAKKKKDPLPSTFPCLFCNHEHSVTVKIDKKAGIGELSCKVCGQHFQTGINYLSAGVDVYSDWIDACDSVAKDAANDSGPTEDSTQYQSLGRHGGTHPDIQMTAGEGHHSDRPEGYGQDII
ncbi:MAG: hypothetical protein Q9222_000781 [Ikaeria aurantiellina]